MNCHNCNNPFTPWRSDQLYCKPECYREADHRELRRARAIYRCLYWWRFQRKTAMDDLRFICREIRAWIDEDKAAGRPPPPPHRHDADRGINRRELRLRKTA